MVTDRVLNVLRTEQGVRLPGRGLLLLEVRDEGGRATAQCRPVPAQNRECSHVVDYVTRDVRVPAYIHCIECTTPIHLHVV